MKYLLLLPLFLILVPIYAIPNDYNAFIYTQNGKIFSVDQDGNNIINGTKGPDDFKIINYTIYSLTNGGDIVLQKGDYNITKVIKVLKDRTLEGQTNSYTHNYGTRLILGNGGAVQLREPFSKIDKLALFQYNKTDGSGGLFIVTHNAIIGHASVIGNPNSVCVYFWGGIANSGGTPDDYIDDLALSQCSQAIRFQNATQVMINHVIMSQYMQGIAFINSDHNFINDVHTTNGYAGSQDVVYGASLHDTTLANIINFATISNLVVNNLNNSRPNYIHIIGVDGPLTETFTNGGKGNIVFDHTTTPYYNGK